MPRALGSGLTMSNCGSTNVFCVLLMDVLRYRVINLTHNFLY